MYGLVAFTSFLIRQLYLPNPFLCFGDVAIMYNWMAGIAIQPVAYACVGLFYERGSFPALGSFLYLLAYACFTGILLLMSIFQFVWWWDVVIVIAILLVFALIARIRGNFEW